MASTHVGVVLRQVRQLIAGQGAGDLPDQQLLERFVAHGEEAAFEALLRRHGPMVSGVCRRVLGRGPDVEDAFQATFLIFTRMAKTIRKRQSVGSWLHGVAHRVALRTRAEAARQRSSARRPQDLSTEGASDDITWRELRAVLDEEMARLSERHRAPLVLCYLESLTQDEAARRLGWSKSTLRRRLEAGRLLLRTRLARRGVTLPVALFATLLAEGTSRAAIPTTLLKSTATAAFAAGQGVAGLSAKALLLAREGLPALGLPKLKLTAVLVLAVGLSAGAGAFLGHRGSAVDPPPDERPQQSPAASKADNRKPVADHYGDSLPDGAVARLGTVRFNHGDGLDALHFTPDGKTIVSAGGGLLRLWDAATGKELGQIPTTRSSWDDATVLSSDGKTVICLGQEFAGDMLRVWDLAQRKEVRTAQLPVRRGELSVFRRNALSRDGRLAVVHAPAAVRVFDIETAKELCKLPLTGKEVQAAVFACNDRVVTAFKKQTIEVWEARTGKSVRQFAHGAPVEILATSPDGRRLATLEHHISAHRFLDKDVVHLWDLTTGTEKHQLAARPNRWYQNLQFSPDGKLLLTRSIGSDRGELTVWDAETGHRLRELDGGAGQFMAFSPDGSRLADGSAWGKFGLYDLKTGRRLSPEDSQLEGAAVSLSPQGERVLTIGYASISTWDTTTSRRLHSFKLPGRWFRDPRRMHSPDGRYALSFTQEGNESQILVWDVAAGKRLHTVRLPDKASQVASAFSPNSSLLATWHPGREAVVRLWNVRTGKEVRSFKETKAGWASVLYLRRQDAHHHRPAHGGLRRRRRQGAVLLADESAAGAGSHGCRGWSAAHRR